MGSGSVVALRLKRGFVQYCGGASCGRRGAGAAARGFDPRQREQRCSGGGGGRHSYLDHLVTLDESDQSLEMLKGRLSLPLLTQKTPLQLNAFLLNTDLKLYDRAMSDTVLMFFYVHLFSVAWFKN